MYLYRQYIDVFVAIFIDVFVSSITLPMENSFWTEIQNKKENKKGRLFQGTYKTGLIYEKVYIR